MKIDRTVPLAIGVSLVLHAAVILCVALPGGGSGGPGGGSAARRGEFRLTRAAVIRPEPVVKVVRAPEEKPENDAVVVEENASPTPSVDPEATPESTPAPEPVDQIAENLSGTSEGGEEAGGGTGNGDGSGTGDGFGLMPAGKEYFSLNKVDVKPEYLRKAKLRYPEIARRNGKEASVIVEADIDEKGRIDACRVLSQPAGYGFEEAALAFVKGCRFSSAMAKGKKVPVRMRLTVKFTLK